MLHGILDQPIYSHLLVGRS